jgi:methylthioribose-1-phosphate isomerase
VDAVCEAIRSLRVRGAPALGVAGAYGLLVALEEAFAGDAPIFHSAVPDEASSPAPGPLRAGVDIPAMRAALEDASARILATRPTAINLGWALCRMAGVYGDRWNDPAGLAAALLAEADAIHREDLEMCVTLGRHGGTLLADGDAVLTHCNTGGLATSGFGTALGVVFTAAQDGKKVRVYADETRPLLQGARLTAWECRRNGIPVTVLVEGAAASLLASGKVSCVIVGADRIAANGDTANKVGTLGLAILAKRYGVPFYVAAPSSTIDRAVPDGDAIPIEQRSATEVTAFGGVATAPGDADAFNPAFDVTPGELIAGIITEEGVLRPPYDFGGA